MLVEPEHSSGKLAIGVRLWSSLAQAEPAWRALERDGLLTPYQGFDWISQLSAARGERDAVKVVEFSADGRAVALLPLILRRRAGMVLGEIYGSDLSNSDWLIQARDVTLDPGALATAFALLRADLGRLDVLRFSNLPPSWEGVGNPLLAFPHQPAPDHFYVAPMGAGAEPRLTKKRRVDIVRGKKRLEEQFGPVTLHRADTVAAIERAHAAFLAQRGQRFAEMGIANIFAEPYFVRFFHDAAIAGIGHAKPALCFHTLEAGGEVLATAIGTCTNRHYSQYINSNTDGPAAKYSLIGLLMLELSAELDAAGITSIDMGIGDFAYKTAWADRTEVFDLLIPLSPGGQVLAGALRLTAGIKRTIKQNEALWSLAKRVRGALLRRGDAGKTDND